MSRDSLPLRLAAVLMAAPLLLAACGGGESEEGAVPADTVSAAPMPAPAPTPTTGPAVTDPQIAAIVVAANAVDSTAGELARTKGESAEVKEFAQRMITDHGGVNQQAVALVTKLNVTPEENPTSTGLKQGGEQAVQRMQGLSGAAFDRAYIDNEVTYHQTVLDAIDQTLIPSAQNAELKALLEQTRPAVAAHLDHAKRIQSSLPPAAQ